MRKIRKQKLLSSSSEDEMPSRLHSPPIRNLTPKATNVVDVANHSEGVHHQNPSNILKVSEIPNDDGNFSQDNQNISCRCCPTHKNNGEMFKTIVRNQVMMRNILTDVLQEIKNINDNKSNIETDEESVLKNIVLPIDSEEGLNELEDLLKADNNFKYI